MDLTLLTSFLVVSDVGTITDAADQLHVSQSALSRRLQQLERDLGSDLVVRGRHGVELTDAGRVTLEHGRAVVARYERLREELRALESLETGAVRIGGGATVTSYLLPSRIAAFQRTHPGVSFHVKEAGSQEIAADVGAGHLELGVVTLPVREQDLVVRPLLTDDIVLIARRDHPLAARRATARDLRGQRVVGFEAGSAIRAIVDNALRAAGIDVRVMMELRSIPSILQMVATTGNLAFVSSLSVPEESDVQVVAVKGLSISRRLGVVTRRDVPLSAAAGSFLAMLGAA
jgi:DNA-binding transcriptional LysR family regulator